VEGEVVGAQVVAEEIVWCQEGERVFEEASDCGEESDGWVVEMVVDVYSQESCESDAYEHADEGEWSTYVRLRLR
jgi:hypothetical protein